MAFHRDHVKRFLDLVNETSEEKKAIEARAEAAILDGGGTDAGIFSGGKLLEILGKSEHVKEFDKLWETGKLHP